MADYYQDYNQEKGSQAEQYFNPRGSRLPGKGMLTQWHAATA